MTRLKGIMINGEWLGERVIVNNCFRSICAISPVIMLEAVKLINKIDYKRDVFEIRGFEFLTTDTIQIWFEGKKIKGIIDLTFGIKDAELFLKSSFLDVKPLKEELPQDMKIEEPFKLIKKEAVAENNSFSEELSNIENVESNQIAEINTEEVLFKEESEPSQIQLETNIVEALEEDTNIELSTEENSENLEEVSVDTNEITEKVEDVLKETKPTANDLKKDLVQKGVILDTETLLSKIENYNIQDEKEEKAQKEKIQEEKAKEEKDVNNKVELNLDVQSFENVSESTADFVSPEEPVDVAIDTINTINTINDIHKEDNTEDVLAPNVLKEDEKLVSSENSSVKKDKFDVDIDFVNNQDDTTLDNTKISNIDVDIDFITETKNFNEEPAEVISNVENKNEKSIDNDVVDKININVVAKDINVVKDIEDKVEDEHNVDEIENTDITEPYIDEVSDENAEESLMDFYFTEEVEKAETSEKDLDEVFEDDIIVQAMLSEMVALKEELDILKNSPQKNDLKEAFWNERRNNKNQVISDEEADFKILSTNEKINAAILDNDSFFAGEKIYKWGDTLYLNE